MKIIPANLYNVLIICTTTGTGKSLSEALLFAEHGENMLCTEIVLNVKKISVHKVFSPCSELGILTYCIFNSMNNLLSHCGLVDAKIRASDKDLPVYHLATMNINTLIASLHLESVIKSTILASDSAGN